MLTNVYQAKAIIYEFNDFNPASGSVSASGFFDINDNGDRVVDFASELTDFEFVLTGTSSSYTHTPTTSFINNDDIQEVTVTDTLLDFTTATSGTLNFRQFPLASGSGQFAITPNFGFEQLSITSGGQTLALTCCTLQATAESASVPFEFSPTLGLLVVGSVIGVSHLHKRIIISKLNDQDLA